ncbi:MAG TPA: hypothetical protein VKW08_03895 [Xanthobacteraceae bacterium]|jgi:hypothetical protein|nr:hypothetical protein [Xanthobacteraceae bacterium]
MNWHPLLAILGGIVQILSAIPYVRDMLWGQTRPNIISWSLWTVLQSIALAAQLSAGFSWSVLLLVAMTFNTAVVAVLGSMGYGYRRYGGLDYTCGAIGAAAIVLWLITGEPLVALTLSVAADFIIAIPTVVKTIRDPHSETLLAWFLVAVASALTLLSTTAFTPSNLLYPSYLFLITASMTCIIFFGRGAEKA